MRISHYVHYLARFLTSIQLCPIMLVTTIDVPHRLWHTAIELFVGLRARQVDHIEHVGENT